MKQLFTLFLLIGHLFCNAQQVALHHTYYTSYFNEANHEPDSVVYELTSDMVSCATHLKRQAQFTADPDELGTNYKRDYTKSNYDCGHNMPAEDNACDTTGMRECFYYTQMFPQTAKLNRGVWKALETQERHLAQQYGHINVTVWHTGVAGYIGSDSVLVPAYCWKRITLPDGQVFVYKFPNTLDVTGKPQDYQQ